jgi:hypothetical protein
LPTITPPEIVQPVKQTIGASSNFPGVQISEAKLKRVQKCSSNVEVDGNGVAVAISCHICRTNVPDKIHDERNPFFNPFGLRIHYMQKQKDEADVVDVSLDGIFEICRKIKISADNIDCILNGLKPQSPSLAINSGAGT